MLTFLVFFRTLHIRGGKVSEFDYVFVCPKCGFIRGGLHQSIETCNYCGQSLMYETDTPYSAFPQELSFGHMRLKIGEPDYIAFEREIYETIIEPMGQLDKESLCFRENYAKYYNLPEPEETRKHNEELMRRAQIKREIRELEQQLANRPKCPSCGSVEIRDIGTGERLVSTGLFGLASGKIAKQRKCRDCGYMW